MKLALSFVQVGLVVGGGFTRIRGANPTQPEAVVSHDLQNMPRYLQSQNVLKMELKQAATSDEIYFLRGEESPGVGDIYTWNRQNKLYRETVGEGNEAGENEGHCVRLTLPEDPNESTWNCNLVLYLPEGQIHVHGPFGASRTTCVITGGTGLYVDVTGTMERSYDSNINGTEVYNYVLNIEAEKQTEGREEVDDSDSDSDNDNGNDDDGDEDDDDDEEEDENDADDDDSGGDDSNATQAPDNDDGDDGATTTAAAAAAQGIP